MTRKIILIITPDTLGAALLGGAIELAGFDPLYPQREESARAALRRTRPAVVLIDCSHPDACAESFIGPALMTGARVILVSSSRTPHVIPEGVARLDLPALQLPRDAARLAEVLGREGDER